MLVNQRFLVSCFLLKKIEVINILEETTPHPRFGSNCKTRKTSYHRTQNDFIIEKRLDLSFSPLLRLTF